MLFLKKCKGSQKLRNSIIFVHLFFYKYQNIIKSFGGSKIICNFVGRYTCVHNRI